MTARGNEQSYAGDAVEPSTLRLAYLTSEFPRASDTWIQREVAALRRQGFTVDTFAVRRPGDEHMVGPEQIESRAGTYYLLTEASPSSVLAENLRAVLGSPRRYLAALRLAWRTRRLGLRGSIYQLIYFVEAVLLAAEMKRRRIDHLHNHIAESSCTVAMLAAAVSGIPFSFTVHGAGIFFNANTWRLDEKVRQAAFVATISHFCRSQTAVFTEPDDYDKLHIVHCGVEPDRIQPVVHRGTARRLLFVGRLVESKGLGVLFRSLLDLRADYPDLLLTVIGDGPDRADLERRARRMGLDDTVRFLGSRSQDEVSAELSRTDIFVLPSFAEGVPVVLMEALAAEVAAVATQVGGVQELVVNYETGLVVRPADHAELTTAIRRLIDDDDLRRSLGKAGRERVLAEFDSEREAERLGRLVVAHHAGTPAQLEPRERDRLPG